MSIGLIHMISMKKALKTYLKSGTGTHAQKRVGTGTDESGTSIDASSNLDFCTLASLSPNSYIDSVRPEKFQFLE